MENNELMNELENLITLHDEDDKEVTFQVLDFVEYKDCEYAILFPVDDEDGGVVILKVDESDNEDEETLSTIEDMDELEAVFEVFKEKRKDDFNFAD